MQDLTMASRRGNDASKDGLNLLCLDGGGIRGLSSLLILKNMMENLDADNPPLPCEYFDLIGGTSTGGLIAIMLGRLRMSVDECITEYLTLSAGIFTRIHHSSVNWKGEVQGRFDHTALRLENGIKDLLRRRNLDENALFKEAPNEQKCRTFVLFETGELSPG
jgi:hypothetical protein